MQGAEERAEELVEQILPSRATKRRMLVIVNPYATTVSNRLKNLVVYALQARYEVAAVETERQAHATELVREAAAQGFELVTAFGGDGTVNEVANGLVGTGTPLTVLPGGSANVFCRILGIPNDVVDATEHLLAIADRFEPRAVDVGRVDGRHFVFAAGIGLDASVVERVDAKPRLKARFRQWFYTYSALAAFTRRYLVSPPRVRLEADGRTVDAVTVIAQNADPFTYFGARPIRVGEGARLDAGALSVTALKKATALELPTLVPRLFSAREGAVQRHRQVEGFPAVRAARVSSVDGRPFPLQVDGDYLGLFGEVELGVVPGGLTVVA